MNEYYGSTDEYRIPNMGDDTDEGYHASDDEQSSLVGEHDEVITKASGDKPTLAPVGSCLKRNMQIEYNRKSHPPSLQRLSSPALEA